MKIGLLAYHSACNFGATLQLLSSYMYWKNEGHTPIVINWIPSDLEDFYQRMVPTSQWLMQEKTRASLWTETRLCRTDQEVAKVIEEENIQAVVVGSDAVAQHHTLRERIVFPCRQILCIRRVTSDRLYTHNPFWGSFNQYLSHPVPVAVLSASSQDSQFLYFGRKLCRQMAQSVSKYAYLSVRDSWTAQMFAHITKRSIVPPVTPDPVFAFNANATTLLPTKKDVITRFGLPEQYVLLSFIQEGIVPQTWIDAFTVLAQKEGIATVSLPFAHRASSGRCSLTIPLPLSPIDWYALIKYSQGYIGNNMHPIVVSLHNAVPFFSFDNYGIPGTHIRQTDASTSKILHILTQAGLTDFRVSCLTQKYNMPTPNHVLHQLLSFPKEKAERFATNYYAKYQDMMSSIKSTIRC